MVLKKFLLVVSLTVPLWAEAPQRTVLPNGIPVIVEESLNSPTCSLNIFIRVGSVFEPPALNGISHFYEHMFFRGTPTRSGLRFKREIEALGGITNATTGRDFTHFYINLPKQYLRQGLELLADAYLNAECSQESIDAERQVVLEEYRLGLNQPGRLMSDRIYSLMFPDHPYGRTIIGSEENLRSIGRSELLKFKRDYYVPARTKLVVTGDVDSREVFDTCRELFGAHQAKGVEERLPVQEPPRETVTIDEFSKSGQTQVGLAFLGPSVKDRADVHRVDLLSFLLGNSKSSLLSKALDAQRSGHVGEAQYLTQAYRGMIILSSSCDPRQEEATLTKFDAVLQQVRRGEFSDKDLQRARKALLNLYRFGLETNAGKADNWGTYETIDRMDFAANYVKEINALTRADLVAAAEKYFSKPHYRLIFRAAARPRS